MTSHTSVISASDVTGDKSTASSVRTFTERTTLHGCQSIMQTDHHVIRRLMWVTLMLVSTGLFLNAFIGGIIRYRSYPSSISVDIQHNKELSLPDVTICNNNFLRKSYLQSLDPGIQSYFTGNPEVSSSVNNTAYVGLMLSGMDPLEEFLSNCRINRIPLDCEKHIQRSVTWIGGCYTLSVADYPLDNTQSSRNGLRFQISLNESEYSNMSNYEDGFGVLLIFHQHGEQADDGLAVNVQPDTDVHVAVRKSQNIRLGTPYSTKDCQAEQKVDYRLSTTYTIRGCEMECFVKYYEDFLGCDYSGRVKGMRTCSLQEVLNHAWEAWDHTYSSQCVCLHFRNETIYSTDVTALAHKDTIMSESSTRRVKKISVHVYYPTFDVNIVTQKRSYAFDSFIADVGGQMGLFLGASILTLSEFIEFFLMYIIKKLK